ncbi:MAG TPA: hypothetical protein VGF89_11340 [Steroidobacteraceae bacterium]|jgi:hypothetical protein
MYLISVVVLMAFAPMASVLVGLHSSADTSVAALVLHWSVFWMVGARLSIAGIRQIVQPRYTAATILGIEHTGALLVVRELGFANLAIGAIGIGSVEWTPWAAPAAVAGAIFYGLAGLNHLRAGQHTTFARIAMISDLWALVVLAAALWLIW